MGVWAVMPGKLKARGPQRCLHLFRHPTSHGQGGMLPPLESCQGAMDVTPGVLLGTSHPCRAASPTSYHALKEPPPSLLTTAASAGTHTWRSRRD